MKIVHNKNNNWKDELKKAGEGDLILFVDGVIDSLFTEEELNLLSGIVANERRMLFGDLETYGGKLKIIKDKIDIMLCRQRDNNIDPYEDLENGNRDHRESMNEELIEDKYFN